MKAEMFFSVDVETAGPVPSEYALLSIGACVVGRSEEVFTCRLKPTSPRFVPEALAVSGLSLADLEQDGLAPAEAMGQFDRWIRENAGDATPVFVGLNAAFDWSFVNFYFHVFVGENPFGFAPLDVKALYMGATGCSWDETRSSRMRMVLEAEQHGDHDALHDALAQAELFELVLRRIIRAE